MPTCFMSLSLACMAFDLIVAFIAQEILAIAPKKFILRFIALSVPARSLEWRISKSNNYCFSSRVQ